RGQGPSKDPRTRRRVGPGAHHEVIVARRASFRGWLLAGTETIARGGAQGGPGEDGWRREEWPAPEAGRPSGGPSCGFSTFQQWHRKARTALRQLPRPENRWARKMAGTRR